MAWPTTMGAISAGPTATGTDMTTGTDVTSDTDVTSAGTTPTAAEAQASGARVAATDTSVPSVT
jgi:hypothetical protein